MEEKDTSEDGTTALELLYSFLSASGSQQVYGLGEKVLVLLLPVFQLQYSLCSVEVTLHCCMLQLQRKFLETCSHHLKLISDGMTVSYLLKDYV